MIPVLALVAILVLFLFVVGMLEVGRQLGIRDRARHGAAPEGLSALQGTAFALLGLLLAFTFNGAASRFDARRELIVQELNALGTAWLRLDLLPDSVQPAVRAAFRSALDQRITGYQAAPEVAAMMAHFDSAEALQLVIWRHAAGAVSAQPNPVRAQVIPALNEMFDIASARRAALYMHPPLTVWLLLGVLTAVCCIMSGYDMAAGNRRSWLHVCLMAGLLTAALYVIVDFEFPRIGVIRLTDFDAMITAFRATLD